jgi:hypothetical protein
VYGSGLRTSSKACSTTSTATSTRCGCEQILDAASFEARAAGPPPRRTHPRGRSPTTAAASSRHRRRRQTTLFGGFFESVRITPRGPSGSRSSATSRRRGAGGSGTARTRRRATSSRSRRAAPHCDVAAELVALNDRLTGGFTPDELATVAHWLEHVTRTLSSPRQHLRASIGWSWRQVQDAGASRS